MKRIATIIAAVFVSAAAQAQNVHIDTFEGRVILQQDRCSNGQGQQATFIESRQNGGGAYGCWVLWNKTVYVTWTQLIGPSGSFLQTKMIQEYPAPPALLR